jgi:hypothetical protein
MRAGFLLAREFHATRKVPGKTCEGVKLAEIEAPEIKARHLIVISSCKPAAVQAK